MSNKITHFAGSTVWTKVVVLSLEERDESERGGNPNRAQLRRETEAKIAFGRVRHESIWWSWSYFLPALILSGRHVAQHIRRELKVGCVLREMELGHVRQ
jgi:hypothetical protein